MNCKAQVEGWGSLRDSMKEMGRGTQASPLREVSTEIL